LPSFLAVVTRRVDGSPAGDTVVMVADYRESPPVHWITTHLGARALELERVRRDNAAKAAKARARARAVQARIDSITRTRWPAAMQRLVRERRVAIGMTPEMVRLSWGEPESINRTIVASGVHEQWVYGPGTYIYLTDRIVTGIQDRR
jgi:hypothetical protein